MCHERWMRRHQRESDEAREVWLDFERTTPVAQPPAPADERPEPMTADAPEEVVAAER